MRVGVERMRVATPSLTVGPLHQRGAIMLTRVEVVRVRAKLVRVRTAAPSLTVGLLHQRGAIMLTRVEVVRVRVIAPSSTIGFLQVRVALLHILPMPGLIKVRTKPKRSAPRLVDAIVPD